ncbi:MAG: 3-oxoacyl-ACP reductase FabG [Campylobacteraceae bacterium]|jgi:3-oxoacyl-[acyl-carrier protein] reductase|nr:3-oxoacyl-ACP reductase FabG [Campylobacteraceae bacterium]
MKFSGKNVLITGAGRGIGANIALTLAGFGLKVWINYNKSEKNAIELRDKIKKEIHNPNIELIQFDASNENNVKEAFDYICKIDKELDYLVNNAGITKDSLTISMDMDNFTDVLSINTTSCFLTSKEALKIMSKKKFGSVVNISSIAGEIGNIGQVNYSASKGAIIAMTKTLALEGARRNIRFNSITPGLVHTDMTFNLPKSVKDNFISKIPLGDFGRAEDVSYGVAFLLSDYSKYITGETMKINGGLYM